MPELTFLIPDVTGGVYHNAVNLAGLLRKAGYQSRFVLTHQRDGIAAPRITDLRSFPSRVFSFSARDNKFYLFRRLATEVAAGSDILVLNDWVDYRLVAHRSLKQKVVGIVHGDYAYYYTLAKASADRIDHFVCVSPVIAAKLGQMLPDRKQDILFIPAVVPDIRVERQGTGDPRLRIIFVGRMTPEKGFPLLPAVDAQLRQKGINCRWTVIAPHSTSVYDEWLNSPDVNYISYLPNAEMAGQYAQQDIILLPSHAEGFPLSLLEAMKGGVVPVATQLETISGALVADGESGRLFPKDDLPAIADILVELNSNRDLLRKMGIRSRQLAFSRYGEQIVLEKWLEILSRNESGKDPGKPVSSIYDRLDRPWLPSAATRLIRGLRKGGRNLTNRRFI